MSTLVTILHVIVSVFLMLTVLLQSGKGGGMGAAFGGGNAATVFGGSGASSFLKKLTAVSATIFMLTSITLAFIASHDNADALAKFGKSQDALRAEKETATQKALDEAAKNNGSGSASSGSGSASGSAATGSNAEASDTHDTNPATVPDGMKPATGSNTKPVDTSVTKPAEAPIPPATGPAKTDTKTDTKPADKAPAPSPSSGAPDKK
ncbi:MAG TPA: preprotein translocase subunit SecG [Kofleriaceae bacterium]|jgi:preprotein translocase subunit SecG|nr:preprotein translocase subunit SecG [Kofleriaceae bacterium]